MWKFIAKEIITSFIVGRANGFVTRQRTPREPQPCPYCGAKLKRSESWPKLKKNTKSWRCGTVIETIDGCDQFTDIGEKCGVSIKVTEGLPA